MGSKVKSSFIASGTDLSWTRSLKNDHSLELLDLLDMKQFEPLL